MKNKSIIVLVAFLALQSCEDFFTTTIKVDPPEHKEQLAIHGFFTAQDSLIRVSVATSVGLLGDTRDDLNKINDAEVTLYTGGNKVAELNYDPDSPNNFYNYAFVFDRPLIELGNDFELQVTHPDYPDVSVSQSIPQAVIPENIVFVDNAGVDENGTPVSGLDITIDDPAGEENYYEVRLVVVDTSFGEIYGYPEYISSIDPSTSPGANYEELLVTDNNFDGAGYTLRITFSNYVKDRILYLQWNTIPKDQYLYSKSIRASNDASDFGGPFAEPVSIYSNIENALGVFAINNSTVIEIQK